jgi:hypothetical protein
MKKEKNETCHNSPDKRRVVYPSVPTPNPSRLGSGWEGDGRGSIPILFVWITGYDGGRGRKGREGDGRASDRAEKQENLKERHGHSFFSFVKICFAHFPPPLPRRSSVARKSFAPQRRGPRPRRNKASETCAVMSEQSVPAIKTMLC